MKKNNFQKKKVAVFDLDGTVFRSSLLIELLEGLIIEEVFPARARKIYENQHHNWLHRKGPYEDYITKVIETHRKFIKGVKAKKVWDVARKVLDFHKNRTYRFTRDLVLELKKTHYLLAISGSPREMVKSFGDESGFNKTYSRLFEINNKGRFTGKIIYEELIVNKGVILKRALKKENLTLKDSIGVGDTEDDIPFLKLVEHPIAFNPNLRLYRYAIRNKWPIILERKDVIYKIGGKKMPPVVRNILKNFCGRHPPATLPDFRRGP